jgi:hypothetical protein
MLSRIGGMLRVRADIRAFRNAHEAQHIRSNMVIALSKKFLSVKRGNICKDGVVIDNNDANIIVKLKIIM